MRWFSAVAQLRLHVVVVDGFHCSLCRAQPSALSVVAISSCCGHATGQEQVFHAHQVFQLSVFMFVCHRMLEQLNCLFNYRRMPLHFVDILFADAVAIFTTAMSCSCSCCFCLFVAVRLCQQRRSQVVSTATNLQPEAVEVASVLSARLWQPQPSSSKADHLFRILEQSFEIHVEVSTWLPVWNIELNS